MRIHRNVLLVGVCGLGLGLLAPAQSLKPGLWQVTTTMTWKQSPFPAGMGPMGGGPHSYESCVTQAQIDKFGTMPPHKQGNCQIENIVKKLHGMTAEMVCQAPLNGKADIESSWTDDSHATTTVHFVGEMQMGPNSKPVEWTSEATSVYKSPDCGSVKPAPTQ